MSLFSSKFPPLYGLIIILRNAIFIFIYMGLTQITENLGYHGIYAQEPTKQV